MDTSQENFFNVAFENAELITNALGSLVQDNRDAAESTNDRNTKALFLASAEKWQAVLNEFSDAYDAVVEW